MKGSPDPFLLGVDDLSLATDLYQLTMAAAYYSRWCQGSAEMPRATFELFIRRLPGSRNFLVFAGLEQALAALEGLRFTGDQVEYLRTLPPFAQVQGSFFEALAVFRFRGEVRAMAEGTIFFPDEPVLQVQGSLMEAQLVETLLLSIVNFQTAIASKAARVRLAGPGVSLADFGSRRAHGPQAAAWVARAAYLAGFEATSNVLAGQRLGLPVVGTMAHSYVLAFESEAQAFAHYAKTFPQHTVHLVDTFDSLEGLHQALAAGGPFQGIRLDSGDLETLSRAARRVLDRAGRQDALIYASGDVDEDRIGELLAAGAPIDAFGVGTQLATSADAPHLSGVYKLVEVAHGEQLRPRSKASPGKATYPWRKQVLRRWDNEVGAGTFLGDRLVRARDEGTLRQPGEEPLLKPVMEAGRALQRDGRGLEEARDHCRRQRRALPTPWRQLEPAPKPYPVAVDEALGVPEDRK